MLSYEEGPEISEKELEYTVREQPHLIEPGLRFVASQRQAGEVKLWIKAGASDILSGTSYRMI